MVFKKEEGNALVLVIFLIAIASIVSLLMSTGIARKISLEEKQHYDLAYYLAHSGIEYGLSLEEEEQKLVNDQLVYLDEDKRQYFVLDHKKEPDGFLSIGVYKGIAYRLFYDFEEEKFIYEGSN